MSKRCDGVPGDCPDKISDEFRCDERQCLDQGHHRCGGGLCLSPSLVCDGEVHCNDSSDEENCHTCETWGCSHYCAEESHGPRCFCEKGFQLNTQDERTCMATCLRNEFRCSDGEQCVRMLHRCDGEDNCRDQSDESSCGDFVCPEYRCGNGRQCMPESYVCDGWRDCDDGSDEKDCAPVPFSESTEYSSCLRNHFRCPEGKCIPLHWRCDGEPDCSGDEVDCSSRICPAGYHRCNSNGQCISGLIACDAVEDCADGSDEANCDKCETWGCSQICQNTSLGPVCFCEDGFELDAQDGRTCKTDAITVKNCGKSIVPPKAVYKIAGGSKAEYGKYPWMISLQEYDGTGFNHICGGAVLNENWIVTAAHCLDYVNKPFKYRILAGLHKLSRMSASTVQKIKVAKIFLHKEFDSVTYENDIVLLKTAKPINLIGSKSYINGICLPRKDKDPRGYAKVIGWGHTYAGWGNSDTLKEVIVPIIPRDLCNESYDEDPEDDVDEVKKTMICAGRAKRDSCDNDSGGPLFQTSGDGVSTLIGVVSHGAGCGEENYPGVYTKVSAYKKWMKKIMLK